MKLETFFENFELLTDASNAVAKLREIVLQLAVSGKLVIQDVNDESASALFERIKSKKEDLIRQKKIRKPVQLNPIEQDETPYSIPNSWKWVYLDEISDIGTGSTPLTSKTEYYEGGFIPWITSTLTSKEFINSADTYITEVAVSDYRLRVYPPGTLIIALYGQGKTRGQISQLQVEATINQACAAIVFFEAAETLQAYIRRFFEKQYDELRELSAGGAQPNLNVGKIKETLVPLPPLAEQKRIVEKCDRLLVLCDAIEKRQQQRQESLLKMNDSAISQLLTAQNPDDFQHHWQAICNNFDLLYSIPETIPKLRQAILQLAVQGKLVPQDLADGSASKLLKQIKTEREELAQVGQLKLQQFSPIESDAFPYQLPTNWMWVPLGALLIWGPRNGYSPKPVPEPTKIKSLTLTATTSGRFKGEYFKYVDEETEIASHLWLEDGDILMQRANTIEYVGVAAVYRGPSHQYIYPDLMMKLRCSTFLSVAYIHLAINSEKSRNFLRARATGTSSNMPKINQLTVNSLPIPLPPLAEQKRIVAKVDSLLSLCDALEAKLRAARDSSTILMEVAARQILMM